MFPDFNIHSTPLLILAIQGLLFALLLLWRYVKNQNNTDLFLSLILLIAVWHQTKYTIGFMAWYDTYRNTKINYFLIDLSFFLAPLLYFYIKSVTLPHFRFQRKYGYHFIPGILYILFKIFVYLYDASQPGFENVQNGYLTLNLEFEYSMILFSFLMKMQIAIYLAFTFQHFFQYRSKIQHIFSNAYSLQLNWLRNFLFIYTGLFIYMFIQDLINEMITDLSWMQEWWYYLFTSIAITYVGMVGYFTDTNKLNEINPNKVDVLHLAILESGNSDNNSKKADINQLKDRLEVLTKYMETEKPYLDPNLNLIDLAKSLDMTRAQLSEVINLGIGKNFNDFINERRVEAVKLMIKNERHKELNLLGLAYDCGFNSKSTFNRVFKKWTRQSPTEYIKQST